MLPSTIWLIALVVLVVGEGITVGLTFIWFAVGALGALIAGVVLFREPATPARMFFAALLLVGILGLKATSGH